MKKNLFSSLDRSNKLKSASSDHFDLLVIGGGITGAGIALDAASRGLKVALIEKNDFASGTSSRSTKLIHGGLRYLKQLEIGLVREVGMERAVVHKLAPHLVIPEKMLLPFVDGGTLDRYSTSFALWVYDFLAGVKGDDKRKMLSKKRVLKEEPLIRQDILNGGGLYAEYRTDDARLTIENIKLATSFEAQCINYVKAIGFKHRKGQIVATKCVDELSGEEIIIKSDHVVSAAGPWVDTIRKIDKSMNKRHLFPTKGVHIVVPYSRLPLKYSVYFDVDDGRMIFAIPRNRVTYIGTTDTPFEGNINEVLTNQEDVDYLLNAVNNLFPTCKIITEDVVSSWAGLRPLIYEEGKSASELSRKDEIFLSDSGLVSIAGGKLTGYRKMAEKVVDLIEKRSGKELEECRTAELFLGGGPFKDSHEVTAYVKKIKRTLKARELPEFYASYLVYNYGRQTEAILQNLSKFKNKPEIALARAELDFTIKNESVIKPEDFFIRRTGRMYFNIDLIPKVKRAVLSDFANHFNWDEAKLNIERSNLDEIIHACTHFEYSQQAKAQKLAQ